MPPAVNKRGELQTVYRRTSRNDKEPLLGSPGFSAEKQIRCFRCSNLSCPSATPGPVCDAVIRPIFIWSWHSPTQQLFNMSVCTLPVHPNANIIRFARFWITLTHLQQAELLKIQKITIIIMITRVKVFKENQKQLGKDASLWNDPGQPNCFYIYSQLN